MQIENHKEEVPFAYMRSNFAPWMLPKQFGAPGQSGMEKNFM